MKRKLLSMLPLFMLSDMASAHSGHFHNDSVLHMLITPMSLVIFALATAIVILASRSSRAKHQAASQRIPHR